MASPSASLSQVVVLDDARQLTLRPMRGDDTAALLAMHRSLSPRTVYQRFFSSVPELPLHMAERFTHVDGTDRVAIVAEDEADCLVAVARYDRLPPDGRNAEVALVVTDEFQHHGVGTAMLRLLVSHARAHDVRALVADVLADNAGMLRTFADVGLHAAATYDAGVAHLVMPLQPADGAISRRELCVAGA
jgi:RimJ/RimL family protein N-acetyltransferase